MASARIVFLCVFNGIFSVFAVVMNALVVLVILRNDDLRKGLNLLIVSLAAADLVNSAIAQPMYVYYLSDNPGDTFLVAFEIIAFIGLHASFSNLIGITYYRMKALSRPFTHLLLVSRKDVLITIGLIWVASITIGVVFALNPGKKVSPYAHALMIFLLVVTYIRILWVAKRKRGKITVEMGTGNYHLQAATIEHEKAASTTSAILVGTSLLCFVPDVTLDLMGMAEEQRRLWNFSVLFASSSINPCIVIWRSQQFRLALSKTLRFAN